MKIDLHMHTKKCKQGDSHKRNINAERFVKTIKDNNVSICAITNHNHFDLQQFDEIKTIDEELLVFPGIELDVDYLGERYHIILVCEPQKKDKFYRIFDNEVERNYDTFCLEYESLIDKIQAFRSEELIIIPHFYDKEQAINNELKEKMNEDLKGYLIILEPAKLQTMGVINAHNELSLIGSDVSNWEDYSTYELPEIKFKISSFKKLYELALDPGVFIKTYLNDTEKYCIDTVIKDKTIEKAIDIYRDVNIVFGEKGSGKTKLLKSSLYPYFKEKGYSVCIHEGKDYDKQYKDMLEDYQDSIVKDEEIINRIKDNFSLIINYNESEPNNFIKKFKTYHENNNANKRAKQLKKANAKFSNDNFNSYEDILYQFKSNKQKVFKVKEINENIRSTESEKRKTLNEQLFVLIDELKQSSINDYKTLFTNKNIERLLAVVQESIRKKTGKESKPSNIGFSNLVAKRLERVKANRALQKYLEEIKSVSTRKLGLIPNKGEITQEVTINVLGPEEKHTEKKIYDRLKINNNREIIKKIIYFKLLNFREINDYYKYEEKISSDEFVTEVIKKKSTLKISGNDNYNPSEGEKAILTISGLLEDDNYDCYIFDEIERGLGQKYITNYIVPKLKELRNNGKIIIVSTHNSNIAINTLPSQTVYCDYNVTSSNVYFLGNLYTNQLTGIIDNEKLVWKDKALVHLEGSREMFGRRRNIYDV